MSAAETDAMQCGLTNVSPCPCICFDLGMLQLEVAVSAIMSQDTFACSSECRTACHPARQDLMSLIRHVQKLYDPVIQSSRGLHVY